MSTVGSEKEKGADLLRLSSLLVVRKVWRMSNKHKAQKPWHRGVNSSKASTNPERVVSGKGKPSLRTKATINRLNMYKERPVRDRGGKILHQNYQSKDLPNSRIEPNRKWFGNYDAAII